MFLRVLVMPSCIGVLLRFSVLAGLTLRLRRHVRGIKKATP
jgi:hypothetical protein